MKSAKERAVGSDVASKRQTDEERVAEMQIELLEPCLDRAEAKGERRVENYSGSLYELALLRLGAMGYQVEDHRIECYPDGIQWSWTISW